MRQLTIRFFYYCLFFFLLIGSAGIFFEFVFWPFLELIAGSGGYDFPSTDRLYKWLKLIGIIVFPCAGAMLVYERRNR